MARTPLNSNVAVLVASRKGQAIFAVNSRQQEAPNCLIGIASEKSDVRLAFVGESKVGFGVGELKTGVWLALPHWLIVGLLIANATSVQRRWHFSLRTLLITTTLVAALLGLIMCLR